MSKIIEDWKHALKFYSVWGLAVLAALPDLFNLLRDSGLFTSDQMPESAAWAIRVLAIGTLVLRFVNQKKPPADDTDQAGA